MINDVISDSQLKIKVHHVGGIGGCGPAETLTVFGKDVEWIIYDAEDTSLSRMDTLQEKNYTLVNKCIGAVNSKGKFNVTADQSASSILMPSPNAAEYTYFEDYDRVLIWGKNTRVVRSVDIEINTLDSLVANQKTPQVDFLSIDAQGAELDIINGASSMIKSSIVGIVCEVEFAELYSKQPLFCDIQDRLRKEGFRFCEIYGNMYFNTFPYVKELQGKGFNAVGEALFLKDPSVLIDDSASPEKLAQNIITHIKLAAVAVAFDQLDFALLILQRLRKKKLISLERLAANCHCDYIKLLKIRMASMKFSEVPIILMKG